LIFWEKVIGIFCRAYFSLKNGGIFISISLFKKILDEIFQKWHFWQKFLSPGGVLGQKFFFTNLYYSCPPDHFGTKISLLRPLVANLWPKMYFYFDIRNKRIFGRFGPWTIRPRSLRVPTCSRGRL